MWYWLMEDWRVFQQEKGRRNRCGGDNEWLEGCNDSAWRRPRSLLRQLRLLGSTNLAAASSFIGYGFGASALQNDVVIEVS
ncbi:hypothetical protein glysoja_014638 [Glycine soja]|nr:hypothetical protein glysoja_014638 [Glycine soja]